MKSRQMLLIAAIVVVAAAAGIFYFLSLPGPTSTPSPSGPATGAVNTSRDALMLAGPLGEKALGDPNAPNVVIEYASMTCSHCQRWHEEVYDAFKAKYIDTGKVYFILREYPLDTLATSAFMLARCAPADQYFPIVDFLFEQQKNWAFVSDPAAALLNLMKQAGFSEESFRACLSNQQILDGVNWVKARGLSQFGVDATPTFFFNGEKKSGEQTLADIDRILGG